MANKKKSSPFRKKRTYSISNQKSLIFFGYKFKYAFSRIRKLTKSLFPVQEIVSDAFSDILKERFSISGTMVKNVLVNEYNLENQITFLHHIFLFKDDIIFLFYRRIFEQVSILKLIFDLISENLLKTNLRMSLLKFQNSKGFSNYSPACSDIIIDFALCIVKACITFNLLFI